MQFETCLLILGVETPPEKLDFASIRKAYLRAALATHPDSHAPCIQPCAMCEGVGLVVGGLSRASLNLHKLILTLPDCGVMPTDFIWKSGYDAPKLPFIPLHHRLGVTSERVAVELAVEISCCRAL